MILKKRLVTFFTASTVSIYAFPALTWALSTDRDQPAVIEADEAELDFNTGQRIYKGNVVVEQGTLLIKGDKLIVVYKDEEMETATSWGNPATFKQRPDDKDEDVLGKGRQIILNRPKNTLTLITNASLKQGGDWANGEVIVYDMNTDKMVIKSVGKIKKAKPGEEPTKKKRARVVIMPTKKSTLAPTKKKKTTNKDKGTKEPSSSGTKTEKSDQDKTN